MATPILKWVGGKRKLLPQLAPLLPPANDIHHYAEPFVGGGAMLFHVASQWPEGRKKLFRLNINDNNADLISFYHGVCADPGGVADVACRLASQHSAMNYRRARNAFNDLRALAKDRTLAAPSVRTLHAGLLLYLNKCGFNGLYRTNKAGAFNVPPNAAAKWRPKLSELEAELTVAAKVLSPCTRTHAPFGVFITEQIDHSINTIEPESVFFFVDPPYLNEEQNGFVSYGEGGWSSVELMDLALCMQQVHDAGARFMLTHADTPFARELFNWDGCNITEVTAKQTISQTSVGRGERAELVVRNYA